MLFFQIILLGGYLYAHVLSVYLKARAQVITHTVLLTASLLFLPISRGDSWKPTSDQTPYCTFSCCCWQPLVVLTSFCRRQAH